MRLAEGGQPAAAAALAPKISQCFPRAALADLPSRIENFCFPDVGTLRPCERSSATYFTFVLTQTDGSRTYGFCRRYLSNSARPQRHRHDCGPRFAVERSLNCAVARACSSPPPGRAVAGGCGMWDCNDDGKGERHGTQQTTAQQQE